MFPACIVAFGASTVFGRVDPEGGGFIGRLKTWHESHGRKNRVYNLGISSETSADLLKRLVPEATPRKPDLILLSAGTNDARRAGRIDAPPETPIEQFETNVRELLRQAKSLAPVVWTKLHPIDETRTQPLGGTDKYFLLRDLRAYVDVTERVCKEESIPYLDIFSDWLQRDYFPWLCEDGLHPNADGHQRMFEALREFLTRMYGK